MKILLGAAFLAIMLLFPAAANAGCTLGVKDCKNGLWHVCETCGSQTCMISQGTSCLRPDTPQPADDLTWLLSPDSAEAANMSMARTAVPLLAPDGLVDAASRR